MSNSTDLSNSSTRYRIEEMQDDEGNVVYPHTDAKAVWADGILLQNILSAEVSDEQINAILNGQGGSES